MSLRPTVIFVFVLLLFTGCGPGARETTLPDNLPTSEAPVTEVVIESGGPTLPNGRLLFVKGGDIWLFQGSDIRRITATGKTIHARWSPDGEQIAYVQREESYSDIYIRSLQEDGRGTRVTRSEPPGVEARTLDHVASVRWALYPTWSPSGNSLAYASQRVPPYCQNGSGCDLLTEYPLSLYVFRVAALVDGALASPENNLALVRPDTDIQRPTWSPSGRYIAFSQASRYPEPGQTGLTIGFFDVETSEYFTLPGIPDGAYDPAWSPDGGWLTFARRDGAGTDLWAIRAPAETRDVGSAVQLTMIGNARAPVWSPDGAYLAFLQIGSDDSGLSIAAVQSSSSGLTLGEPEILLQDKSLDADSGLSWSE